MFALGALHGRWSRSADGPTDCPAVVPCRRGTRSRPRPVDAGPVWGCWRAEPSRSTALSPRARYPRGGNRYAGRSKNPAAAVWAQFERTKRRRTTRLRSGCAANSASALPNGAMPGSHTTSASKGEAPSASSNLKPRGGTSANGSRGRACRCGRGSSG